MSSANDTNVNANKNNGYRINTEKLPNIYDATLNKNYFTSRSPERITSCSPALISQKSSIVIKLINNSEKIINSQQEVLSNMNKTSKEVIVGRARL